MSAYLEIPWGESQYFRKKYGSLLTPRGGQVFIYRGDGALPADLAAYRTDDFSHARWLEDDARLKAGGGPAPVRRAASPFKPKDHQIDGAKKIYQAYREGSPGFLLADKTGVGKTLTSLVAVTALARTAGHDKASPGKLLIVCPKGVIPVWRQTLRSYPSALARLRPLVINYQQLGKLLTEPSSAAKAKRTKTKNRNKAKSGKPTVDWDYVIFDEAHHTKNYPSSSMSLAAVSVAKLGEPYRPGKTPFVIYSTATPGSSPLNFALMAGWLAPLVAGKRQAKQITPDGWGDFLAAQGFAVSKGKMGYSWAAMPWYGKNSDDPAERKRYRAKERSVKARQREDAKRIGKALLSPGAPFIMRSPKDIAGWPEQQSIALPIELDPAARGVYEQAWTAFRDWLKLTPARQDPKGALVQQLRYRQKASLLKVPSIAETVLELVSEGNQVFISAEFMETLDRYREILEGKGVTVAEISGRNVADRDAERIRFQRGTAQVVLCTVVAGISLHAGETLPDGTRASSAPRVTIISDVRQNPLDTVQAMGRAHRDGTNSVAYFPYIEDTVDQKVIESFINKHVNMQTMLGSPEEEAAALEAIYRAAAR